MHQVTTSLITGAFIDSASPAIICMALRTTAFKSESSWMDFESPSNHHTYTLDPSIWGFLVDSRSVVVTDFMKYQETQQVLALHEDNGGIAVALGDFALF